MADIEEPKSGTKKTLIGWAFIIAGLAVAGYLIYSMLGGSEEMKKKMERVREFKALKSLTDKENVSEN